MTQIKEDDIHYIEQVDGTTDNAIENDEDPWLWEDMPEGAGTGDSEPQQGGMHRTGVYTPPPNKGYPASGRRRQPSLRPLRRRPQATATTKQPLEAPEETRDETNVRPPQEVVQNKFSLFIPAINYQTLFDAFIDLLAFIIRYSRDVIRTSTHLLRKPISYVLAFYVLLIVLAKVWGTISASFCWVPGISSSAACVAHGQFNTTSGPPFGRVDYPGLTKIQNEMFGNLIGQTAGGTGLALEVKESEMATKDLIALVKHSELKSRDEMAEALADFVYDAKRTSKGLSKFGAKVGGVVDTIMAVNQYSLRMIEDARQKGVLTIGEKVFDALVPWAALRMDAEEVAKEWFATSMATCSNGLQQLILEATAHLDRLDALEDHLDVIHDMIQREDKTVTKEREELLAQLWSMVGGNRKEKRGIARSLELLSGLGAYRRKARGQVVDALHTLHVMSDELEDLRERVIAPELLGEKVPIEVHMDSIQTGLERLKERRVHARQLEEEARRRILGDVDA